MRGCTRQTPTLVCEIRSTQQCLVVRRRVLHAHHLQRAVCTPCNAQGGVRREQRVQSDRPTSPADARSRGCNAMQAGRDPARSRPCISCTDGGGARAAAPAGRACAHQCGLAIARGPIDQPRPDRRCRDQPQHTAARASSLVAEGNGAKRTRGRSSTGAKRGGGPAGSVPYLPRYASSPLEAI